MLEAALPGLLERFYERVRADPMLGPVFTGAVESWPDHMQRLEQFWSSVMFGTGVYKGNPMQAHLQHAAVISVGMFERWLQLWSQVTNELLIPQLASVLQQKAARIAESLMISLRLRR